MFEIGCTVGENNSGCRTNGDDGRTAQTADQLFAADEGWAPRLGHSMASLGRLLAMNIES